MDTRIKLIICVFVLIGLTGLIFWLGSEPEVQQSDPEMPEPAATSTEPITRQVIGRSVEGRDIVSYRFGTGDIDLFFVGGIHGGYEWNSSMLAYEMIDSFRSNEIAVPADVTVHVIPDLNPDGTFKVTDTNGVFALADIKKNVSLGTGRFNANGVDLNRNFDCKWQPESTWRGNAVSAGSEPFSEPEAAAFRDYVAVHQPVAVIFWHSQANAVYASECETGILPGTKVLMNTYAGAANYRTVDVFDAYAVTGDAEGWLASIGIPAITVEFSSHESLDWNKNLDGVKAVLEQYIK